MTKKQNPEHATIPTVDFRVVSQDELDDDYKAAMIEADKNPFWNNWRKEPGNSVEYCCDCCGKWSKGKYGITIRYETPSSFYGGRVGLCGRCANKLAGIFEEVEEIVRKAVDELQEKKRGEK